jgi:hypothetical protein
MNFPLKRVHELALTKQAIITQRASQEAQNDFGYSFEEVLEAISTIEASHFFKSDISRQNGQPFDVYKRPLYSKTYGRTIEAYIKIRISKKLLVISFHSSDS